MRRRRRQGPEADLEQALMSGQCHEGDARGQSEGVSRQVGGPAAPPLVRSGSQTTTSELSIELTGPLDSSASPVALAAPRLVMEVRKPQNLIFDLLSCTSRKAHSPQHPEVFLYSRPKGRM